MYHKLKWWQMSCATISWSEQWYEALDDASRLYFGEDYVDGMINAVSPLHEKLARGPQTAYEKAFVELYGKELDGACRYLAEAKSGRKRGIGTCAIAASVQ